VTIVPVQVQVATTDLARAVMIDPVKAELTGPAKAAPIDPAAVALTGPVEAALVIWTAKLRTGPEVDKAANGSRTFNAAVVIASAVEDLAAVALVAGEASGAGDRINAWNFQIFRKAQTTN